MDGCLSWICKLGGRVGFATKSYYILQFLELKNKMFKVHIDFLSSGTSSDFVAMSSPWRYQEIGLPIPDKENKNNDWCIVWSTDHMTRYKLTRYQLGNGACQSDNNVFQINNMTTQRYSENIGSTSTPDGIVFAYNYCFIVWSTDHMISFRLMKCFLTGNCWHNWRFPIRESEKEHCSLTISRSKLFLKVTTVLFWQDINWAMGMSEWQQCVSNQQQF